MNELLESLRKSAESGEGGHMSILRNALLALAALDGHKPNSECVFCINVGTTSAKAVLTRGGATLAKVEWPMQHAMSSADDAVSVLASEARTALRKRLAAVNEAVNIVLGRG